MTHRYYPEMDDDGRCLIPVFERYRIYRLYEYCVVGSGVSACCACHCETSGYLANRPMCRPCYTIMIQRMEMINRASFDGKIQLFLQREILLFGRCNVMLRDCRGTCTWHSGFLQTVSSYYKDGTRIYNLCHECETIYHRLIHAAEHQARNQIYDITARLYHCGLLRDIVKIIGMLYWRLIDVRRLAADSLLE